MPRISITVKNAFVYFVLLVLTSATLGFAIYKLSSKRVMENTLATLIHNNESAVLKFNSFLDDVRRDVWYLSKNPFLKDYLGSEGDHLLKKKLAEEFLALLSAKNQYAQIRFIGLTNKGKELIRVEQFKEKAFVVADSLLQVKGDRDYFRETIQLPEDSIYFSQINLNQEYGKILFPFVPTLRVATPVFHKQHVSGIMIINVDLTYLFKELEKVTGQFNQLKLINPDGYYLIHPDSSLVFQFEFDRLPNIELAAARQSWESAPLLASQYKAYMDRDRGESIIEFKYPRANYTLYFTLSSLQENLLDVFNKWKLNIVYITLIFILASIFIALYWTRRQARQFSEITKSIAAFGNNPNIVDLNINRDDEIGDLAKSFQQMSSRIHGYVNELMLAKTQADDANKAKQDFIENMSHEMRNPLQSILGMVNMLQQNQPRQDQDAFIRNLKFSADHLLTLVNDVLDYRKLLNDQIQLLPKDIQLKEYLDNIIKGHLFEASQKKIKLSLNLMDHTYGDYFVADPVRLSQVLNNLLSNAIRYSPAEHEVVLLIRALDSNQLRFEILDEGPGMTDENINNVLQLKPVTGKSRQIQNVGLGLPIVIKILSLMQSKLEINRNLSKGMCFGFNLPTFIKHVSLQDHTHIQTSEQLKHLINSCACIDDDPQNIFYYKHIFEKLGVPIDVYAAPELFLQAAKKYDLILSDLNFTETHFADLIDQVQLQLEKGGILIIISAVDDIQHTVSLFEGKIDTLLQKPVSPEQLLKAVERTIYLRHFETPALEQLSQQYDGDQVKSKQALELLLREWKDLGIKLERAITDKNTGEYERIVHRLANSMRLLKLVRLENAMEEFKSQLIQRNNQTELLQAKVMFGFQHCIHFIEEKMNAGLHV